MNNLKKVGLSALAGSLAMFSAQAGEMTLSGSAEATYTSNSGSEATANLNGISGNAFGLSHDFDITGSGEFDNGFTYAINTDMGKDGVADSTILTIDMGDLGKLGLDHGSGAFGIGTLENNVPTAYEEADHMVGSLGHGIDVTGATNALGYSNTFAGVGVSIEYSSDTAATSTEAGGVSGTSAGSDLNYALTYAMDNGLTLAYGASKTDLPYEAAGDTSEQVGSVNYVMGAISVGYQISENTSLGNVSQQNTHYGVAFNVNDSLSVSYSVNNAQDYNVGTAGGLEYEEQNKGVMAAYSIGGASARLALNSADNVGGVTAVTAKNMEISLALAF